MHQEETPLLKPENETNQSRRDSIFSTRRGSLFDDYRRMSISKYSNLRVLCDRTNGINKIDADIENDEHTIGTHRASVSMFMVMCCTGILSIPYTFLLSGLWVGRANNNFYFDIVWHICANTWLLYFVLCCCCSCRHFTTSTNRVCV
jgi:hypothetical protein